LPPARFSTTSSSRGLSPPIDRPCRAYSSTPPTAARTWLSRCPTRLPAGPIPLAVRGLAAVLARAGPAGARDRNRPLAVCYQYCCSCAGARAGYSPGGGSSWCLSGQHLDSAPGRAGSTPSGAHNRHPASNR
jgi:hypothetical protein